MEANIFKTLIVIWMTGVLMNPSDDGNGAKEVTAKDTRGKIDRGQDSIKH